MWSDNIIGPLQAWKGMLDGNYFMKSGWVHSLVKLHQFSGSDGCNSFVITEMVVL